MILTIACVYTFVGILCVDSFGDDLEVPLITTTLPKDTVTWILKFLYCLSLLFTYPLQMYPVHIIIENVLYKNWPKSKKR